MKEMQSPPPTCDGHSPWPALLHGVNCSLAEEEPGVLVSNKWNMGQQCALVVMKVLLHTSLD